MEGRSDLPAFAVRWIDKSIDPSVTNHKSLSAIYPQMTDVRIRMGTFELTSWVRQVFFLTSNKRWHAPAPMVEFVLTPIDT